jgi:hypothetical protein
VSQSRSGRGGEGKNPFTAPAGLPARSLVTILTELPRNKISVRSRNVLQDATMKAL